MFLPLVVARLALAAPGWPELSAPPPFTGGGELDAAVLIGIDDYDALPDVTGAVVNVDDWQAWLVATRGVRPVAIERRTDGDAVDNSIREAVRQAVARVQPGGTLWLVYAGHGAPSDEGAQPMFVGADARPTVDGIRSRSVPLSEIEALLAKGKQAHTVLVLDACFAGQGADGRELVAERLAPARGVPELVAPANMTVLAATSANQYAGLLPGAARPAFSYLVLGALRGWGDHDGSGKVSAQEAADYAAGALKLVVTGRRQEPRVSGEVTVALGSGRERGPDLVALSRSSASSGSSGTEVNLGGSTDFARAAAVARAKEEEARRSAEEAAQARAAALAAQREQVDEAVAAVQRRARADWTQVRSLLTADAGPETAAVLDAFVRQYDAASVTVGDVTEAVEVPEVEQARVALAEVRRRVGGEALAARRREEAERRAWDEEEDEDEEEVTLLARAAQAARAWEEEEDEEQPVAVAQREREATERAEGNLAETRSEASIEREAGSARVPLLATGGLVVAGGLGLLVAGEVSKQQVLATVEAGGPAGPTADSQQNVVNSMFGAGYACIGVGVALGGIGLAVPADGSGMAVVVSGQW